MQRGHNCKATQRYTQSVRLRAGSCLSQRKYKPKLCGACPGRCCTVHAATTITVAFYCPLHAVSHLLSSATPVVTPHFQQEYQYVTDNRNNENQQEFSESSYYHYKPIKYDSLKNIKGDKSKVKWSSDEKFTMRDIINNNKISINGISESSKKKDFPNMNQNVLNAMDEGQPLFEHNLGLLKDFSSGDPQKIWQYNKRKKRSSRPYQREKENIDQEMPFKDTWNEMEASHFADLAVENDSDFERIQRGNYEVVNQKVAWIIRCHCAKGRCDDDNDDIIEENYPSNNNNEHPAIIIS